ncbi:DNA polymerase III subunit gamma/tau [Ferruginibacter sp.]|uniref:DNA polymerase III subunit gamma/tau n=1 Tax=Ferruginibacter sp. TaxID=1940288 RepID=UPI00199F08D9|nr:DNA polymerase III subunit gamma/tau [Ferruginibacter sp.]MBC7626993.1 DNA polymerase III subunit gamma/tau [Ferruginibacter sp.]
MEKFIVSARKYRPQNFTTVVGQAHITTTLKNAINNNQLAHAFLFCGPRGVGKTTCARILAKTINCLNKTADGEACNTCNSCVSFDNGSSLNIHELDAASNNSVDDIRSLVDQVRFAPQAGDYKVYIVDEVHMLSASAFNAFLKTLEEPPPYAIFILATTEKHKILPTILSRCQIFDFKRITTNDTVEHLREICDKEHTTADNAALHVIAQKSEGCLRDALSILDKIVSFTGGQLTYSNTLEHLNILDEDYFFKLLQFATDQKLSDALLLFDDINQKGFEGDTFLEGFIEFIRNLLVSKDVKAAILLEVAEDFRDKYLQAAKEISANWMIAALNTTHEAALNYKQARNKRLCVEMALIKLCYLNQAVEFSEGTNEMLVKKKLVDSSKPVSFKGISFIKIKETPAAPLPEKKPVVKEAALFIKKEIPAPPPVVITKEIIAPVQKRSGFGSLEKIRARLLLETKQEERLLELTDANLLKAWTDYTETLFSEKKYPVVTQFKMAVLRIDNEFNFTVVTEGVLQQRFIEMERSSLIPYMQKYFGNKLLKYSIEIIEPEAMPEDDKKTLSSKQQYELMIVKYPLIKELKDRLRLEIDY